MLKIISFGCFLIAGGIWGAAMSDKLKIKMECCCEIQAMLMQISVMIRCRALDVYEISKELHSISDFKRISFPKMLPEEYEPERSFRSIWTEAVAEDKAIPDEERRILVSFGEVIGTSDIEGQNAAIESALEKLEEVRRIRTAEYRKKGKLYRSTGVLFGTMAGIMAV